MGAACPGHEPPAHKAADASSSSPSITMLSRIAVRSRLTVPRVSPIAARGYSENTFK